MLKRGMTENNDLQLKLLLTHEGRLPDTTTPAEIAQYYFMLATFHPGSPLKTEFLRKPYLSMPDARSPACKIDTLFAKNCWTNKKLLYSEGQNKLSLIIKLPQCSI